MNRLFLSSYYVNVSFIYFKIRFNIIFTSLYHVRGIPIVKYLSEGHKFSLRRFVSSESLYLINNFIVYTKIIELSLYRPAKVLVETIKFVNLEVVELRKYAILSKFRDD